MVVFFFYFLCSHFLCFLSISLVLSFSFAAQVTYNSQKREQRVFKQPGGGGVVEDAVLLTGSHLTQRLNEIYSMSDDEDDLIESIDVVAATKGKTDVNNAFSSTVLHSPQNGGPLYGNVRQTNMQLSL